MFGLGWQELLLILIVGGVIYTIFFSPPVRRRLTGVAPAETLTTATPAAEENAEEILARRYARGELDQQQYESMRATIQRNRT